MSKGIEQFLNDNGVLIKLASEIYKKFKEGSICSLNLKKASFTMEQDVNLILRKGSSYSDYPILRRFLMASYYPNTSIYHN